MARTSRKRADGGKQPNLFQVISQSIYIATHEMSQAAMAEADVSIMPDLGFITLTDFDLAEDLIQLGRKAGETAVPEIRELLERRMNRKAPSP